MRATLGQPTSLGQGRPSTVDSAHLEIPSMKDTTEITTARKHGSITEKILRLATFEFG